MMASTAAALVSMQPLEEFGAEVCERHPRSGDHDWPVDPCGAGVDVGRDRCAVDIAVGEIPAHVGAAERRACGSDDVEGERRRTRTVGIRRRSSGSASAEVGDERG